MIEVRLSGELAEVQKLVEQMKGDYRVLAVSPPYKNRNSEYVRVYLEIKS